MNQFLLALTGIPASGKTALARQIVDIAETDPPIALVETDLWRDDKYYADFSPVNERMVRSRALERTHHFLTRGWCVINDDTNYYESMRHELYDIALRIGCAFGVIHIATPLDVALKWNRSREHPVPDEVIRRIADRLDPPGLKYSWDKPLLSVDLSVISVDEAASMALERLTQLKPVQKRKTRARHLGDPYDAVTRQVVRAFIAEYHSYVSDSEVSRIRREVLQEARGDLLTEEQTRRLLWNRLTQLTILSSKR